MAAEGASKYALVTSTQQEDDFIQAIRRVSGTALSDRQENRQENDFIKAIRRASGTTLSDSSFKVPPEGRSEKPVLLGNANAGVIEATRRLR